MSGLRNTPPTERRSGSFKLATKARLISSVFRVFASHVLEEKEEKKEKKEKKAPKAPKAKVDSI